MHFDAAEFKFPNHHSLAATVSKFNLSELHLVSSYIKEENNVYSIVVKSNENSA